MRRLFPHAMMIAIAWLGGALPAHADLVFLASGRTLSVRAHRIEDGQLVLDLRGGGQIVCAPSLVSRIEPDEVEYPDPTAAAPRAVAAAVAPAPVATPGPARPYDELVGQAATANAVDPRLVHAMISVESGYRSDARSPKGAMGLMQLMPATAQQYAVKNPYDPKANVDAGVRHLKSLLGRYSIDLALAAYNAGEAAVARYKGIPPYRETREYVSRVMERAAAMR